MADVHMQRRSADQNLTILFYIYMGADPVDEIVI
jgi:hypothetical protein